jgi:hypothetical protein
MAQRNQKDWRESTRFVIVGQSHERTERLLATPRCGRATQAYRQNRGMIFARSAGAAVILFGFFGGALYPGSPFNLGFADWGKSKNHAAVG